MNYYQILKVQKDATSEQIRDSYITLIKKYHPDIYTGNKEYAEKITKELNDAYDVLSNSEKRAEYDESIFPQTTNSANITNQFSTSKYYSNYSMHNHSNNYSYNRNSKNSSTWIPRFKSKLYQIVDKRTKNLNQNSKILLVLFIIFISLFFMLLSIYDYFQFINT